MRHYNANVSFKSFGLALLAVPLLAVTVGAQTTASSEPSGPAIKRAVDEKEFRRLIGQPERIGRSQQGADPLTINAQALAAISAKTNQQRPTIKDILFSDQLTPTRDIHGRRMDKPEPPGQQEVQGDRGNLLTIPNWSDTFSYQRRSSHVSD